MARAPKYTIKRNWGWMTNIVIRKKSRTRAPKPAFAILRGLGKPSLLAASALGTVLLVTPAVVNKAHAQATVPINSMPLPFPGSATNSIGTTYDVLDTLDCTSLGPTCIDIEVVGDIDNSFVAVEFDDDSASQLNNSFGGGGIVIVTFSENVDVTIESEYAGSFIDVDSDGIRVVGGNDYSGNIGFLGDVNITWDGDIDAGDYGVYVENVGDSGSGNVASVTINVNNVTTGIDGDDGIHVGNVWGGPVDINVAGDINTQGTYADGVEVHDVAGDVFIEVIGSTNTDGYNSDGVFIRDIVSIGDTDGNVTVQMGDITADGSYSDGVDIGNVAGQVNVTTGDITTGNVNGLNDDANGINIYNVAQGVTVGTGNITTFGANSDGIDIDDIGGNVTATVTGDIATTGASADGVDIEGVDGSVNVTVTGDVSTNGGDANGINIDGEIEVDYGGNIGIVDVTITDSVTVDVGDITTDGNSSDGMDIEDILGSLTITAGDVTLKQGNSDGFEIDDIGGTVSIIAGNIDATGTGSHGIDIDDVQGVVDVKTLDISTSGNGAEGVFIRNTNDDVIIDVGALSTNGSSAEAVIIGNVNGSVNITTDGVDTIGNDSRGVYVYNVFGNVGDVTILVDGDISTSGNRADGIAVVDVWDGGVDITVNGNITTSGENADGGFIDPIFGDVNVTINGDINTSGPDSDGWYVQGVYANGGDAGNVSITVNGDITTNGDLGDGIEVFDVDGAVTVDVGDIQTGTGLNQWDNAHGVIIGNVGGGVTVTTGNIATFGDFSEGIVIYDVSEGVIDVNVDGGITTNGLDADGVEVTEFDGDQVDITVTGDIVTNDNNSHGVFVHEVYADNPDDGILINVNNVNTSGEDSDGVNISGNIGADMTVNVGGDILVTGDMSAGVRIGNLGEDFDGKDSGLYGGVYGDAVINVSEDASIYSAADGILVNGAIVAATAGSIEINNDGNIGSAAGAISGDYTTDFGQFTATLFTLDDGDPTNGKEDITLNNEEGSVFEGNMLAVVVPDDGNVFTPFMGGVEINNDGLFDAEGISFLGGKDVQINNDGIFQVTGEYNETAVIFAASFEGKDAEFYNTEIVTLADGDPTDELALVGKDGDTDFDWRGGPGSMLVVDTFLAGPDDSESDQLYIDGDTSGMTEIVVNDVDPASPGAYNPEGIVVVTVDGYSELGDFVLAGGPIDKGLFQYDLYLTDNGDEYEWVLASIPGQAAQEAPSLITGLNELGHQAMAVGVDRLGVLGDCAVSYRPGINPTADVPGCDDVGGTVWMSLLGRGMSVDGDASFGLFGQSTQFDVSYDQVMWGLIAGADGGKTWTNGNGNLSSVYGGVLGGYLTTTMDFDSGNEGSYDGGMAGIYAGYQSGAWFANGVLTGMFGTLSFDSGDLAPFGGADDSDVFQVGGTVDTGFRFGADRGMAGVYFEPGITLSVLSTSIDEAEWAGNEMSFEDSTSFRGRAGAKVGMETEGGFNAYVEASLWNEFGDDPEISIGSLNAPDVSITGDGLGMWADIGLGIGYVSENWAIGAKGDVAYNEDMLGYGGSLKLQVSW